MTELSSKGKREEGEWVKLLPGIPSTLKNSFSFLFLHFRTEWYDGMIEEGINLFVGVV